MTLVLIVDDVPAMAEQYAYDLKRLRGYETLIAKSGRTALESLTRDSVDCVILDLEMPGMDGFEVLRSVERLGLRVPIIVYTGTGDYDRCAQAIRLGAYSFIDKAEPMERVAQEVENAIERRRLTAEVTLLRHGFGLESPLVGTSPALAKLKEAIVRVAPVPSPVLVVGESGTGKELVARELHRLSANPKGPFVALNSAALPHELVESELFGHERGAFTGANATRKGAFEAASGGTLFLDEIGDLPLAAQAKLLRVLEERKVTRIGDPPRSREGSSRGTLPRRPVLSAQRARAARAAAARSSVRRSRASRAPRRGDMRAVRHEDEDRRAGCRRGADVLRLASQQHSRAAQRGGTNADRNGRRGVDAIGGARRNPRRKQGSPAHGARRTAHV